jgi:ATP/maltotriose-dependent transcriptional regulator MalT
MRKQMQFSVERPRLERELDRLEAGDLGVIAGSAGYGKSSSVASWASRLGTPVRWIRGAERLSDALLLAAEDDGGIWLPRLGRAARKKSRIDTCAASICADLAAPYASLTLIIDNTDALTEDPESLAMLRAIAERDPDRSRVIFIGRRRAALRLATARSKRAVLEIGAVALATVAFSPRGSLVQMTAHQRVILMTSSGATWSVDVNRCCDGLQRSEAKRPTCTCFSRSGVKGS